MPFEIVTAIITASGAVIVAGTSYWFTKKREREAELRKEKLDHYKDFVASLSGVIDNESTREGQIAFALACNRLNLVAPQAVLESLQALRNYVTISNEVRTQAEHDHLLSKLFHEMRKDLGVSPSDDSRTFKVGLWPSGVPTKKR